MWPLKKRKPYITIGGERLDVKPLKLTDVIELSLLMAPYWPLLAEHLPRIEQARFAKDKTILSEVLMALREDMQKVPGDMIRAVSILVGVDPLWLAKNATPEDIIKALPVIDKAHDLPRLWGIIKASASHLPSSEFQV